MSVLHYQKKRKMSVSDIMTGLAKTPYEHAKDQIGFMLATGQAKRRHVAQAIRELEVKDRQIVKRKAAYDELERWVDLPLRLERATDSNVHKLIAALERQEAEFCDNKKRTKAEFDDAAAALREDVQIFVVDHDWGAAFKNAKEGGSGPFRLPYEACCFELRVSGARVVALGEESDKGTFLSIAISVNKDFWLILGQVEITDGDCRAVSGGTDGRLINIVFSQVRAICIMLEAEVAVTETVRAPHKLNRAREKLGRAPLPDYRVVTLNRRARAEPLPHGDGEPGTKKRLHFVRGHWRHYSTWKTWIKWMLRGDPDLGFVDKMYRL